MLAPLCALVMTSPSISLRVEGEGYLRVSKANRVAFVKQRRFEWSSGRLVSDDGAALMPSIFVPNQARSVDVRPDGTVLADGAACGRILIARFSGPAPSLSSDGFFRSPERPALVEAGGASGLALRMDSFDAPVQAEAPQPTQLASGTAVIAVRTQSQVDHSPFTLGDIADIRASDALARQLAGITIGDTPPIGVNRVLDEVRVNAKLRMAGVNLAKLRVTIPTGAVVVRRAQNVTADQLLEAARASIREKFGDAGELVPSAPGEPMLTPIGAIAITATSVTENGRFYRATVDVYVDGRKFNSRSLVLERRGVPMPLKVGANVEVRVVSSGIVVKMKGRVTRAGRAGEPVEVTTSDGTKLTGQPLSEGVIEVKL